MRNVRRPILTAALVLANVAAIALNAAILHRHGKLYPGYAIELAQGLWTYGPIGVFGEAPIQPVRLTDLSTAHDHCGPTCPMKAKEVGR